jgi:hypothetical protein
VAAASPDDVVRAVVAAGVPTDAVTRFTQRDVTTISARAATGKVLTASHHATKSARSFLRVQDARGRKEFDYTVDGLTAAVLVLITPL